MLRERLHDALQEAIAARDATASATLRLILAALKDRDVTARNQGSANGVGDEAIVQMLHCMVRQRHESRMMYAMSGKADLAKREADEIAVIERFLPRQMDEPATRAAIAAIIAELDASGAKDIGRVMSTLKQRYPGGMDFAMAGSIVKEALLSQEQNNH